MHDEAIERACAAKLRWNFPGLSDGDIAEMVPNHVDEMRAAISAYLADVPVSDAMVDAGGEVVFTCSDISPDELRSAFKAMCRQCAEELSNGR